MSLDACVIIFYAHIRYNVFGHYIWIKSTNFYERKIMKLLIEILMKWIM